MGVPAMVGVGLLYVFLFSLFAPFLSLNSLFVAWKFSLIPPVISVFLFFFSPPPVFPFVALIYVFVLPLVSSIVLQEKIEQENP